MKNSLIPLMTSLGLTEKQARVYLALLSLGDGNVESIASESKIKRTTLYTVLLELQAHGLATQVTIRGKARFVPESPQTYLKTLRERVDTFALATEELRATAALAKRTPRIFFFEGPAGFRKVWDMLFRSGVKEYCIVTDPREMLGFVSEKYIVNSIVPEKKKRALRSRQLIASCEYTKEIVAKDTEENRQSRVVPHTYSIPVTSLIFGHSVAFISPRDENTIMVIESEAFAKTQLALFNALWNSLSAAIVR